MTSNSSNKENTFNICLVGLSGSENYKGVEGVGKSCLCSRFISTKEDEYRKDHISNISLSDWHSSVVNRNHWLYWGKVSKKIDDCLELNFNLIEQTEFINDESMHAFDDTERQVYSKRCASLKLSSPQKSVYRRKEQFSLQEYNYGKFPVESITIDGFICICDVTEVCKRDFQLQLNELNLILNNLLKAKKPIVLVTTKNDNRAKRRQEFVAEVEKLLTSRKDSQKFLHMQLIETSSHLNINVNLPFFILATMINNKLNKNRALVSLTSQTANYSDSHANYVELNTSLKTHLFSLLINEVTDYKFKYEQFHAIKHKELKQLIDFFGIDFICNQFSLHVNKLKQDLINKKMNSYLRRLPGLIETFYNNKSDMLSCLNSTWSTVQEQIKKHELYARFVIKRPTSGDGSDEVNSKAAYLWYENEHFDNDTRVLPYEVFHSIECKQEFENHVKRIKDANKRAEYKSQLFSLLHTSASKNCIQPGKQLNEINVYLIGRECYECLSEEERRQVYEQFQKDIAERAKSEFKELLSENIEYFLSKMLDSDSFTYKNLTHADIDELMDHLKKDSRFQILDKLSEDRKGLLLKHIAFLMNKSKSTCLYSGDSVNCISMSSSSFIDYLQEKYKVSYAKKNFIPQFRQDKKRKAARNFNENSLLLAIKNVQINFLLLSSEQNLINVFFDKVKNVCTMKKNNKYEYKYSNRIYEIDFQVQLMVNNEILSPKNNEPLICVCYNLETFNSIIKSTLNTNRPTSVAIVFVNSSIDSINDDVKKEEIVEYCKSQNYTFIEIYDEGGDDDDDEKIKKLIEINLTCNLQIDNNNSSSSCSLNEIRNNENAEDNNNDNAAAAADDDDDDDVMITIDNLIANDFQTSNKAINKIKSEHSLNILCCLMCENDFSILDCALAPFFNQKFFHSKTTSPNSIFIEFFNETKKQLISIEFISYHLAVNYLHSQAISSYDGHILVYSIKRVASFENAKSLVTRIRKINNNKSKSTCCLVAVNPLNISDFFNNELSQKLLTNGNKLADDLNIKFITATTQFCNQTFAYSPFFDDCLANKNSLAKLKPSSGDYNQQKIEIILENYKTNDKSSLLKKTEIIITPSPSSSTKANNEYVTNKNDHFVPRINESYLSSPNHRYKSSSSSSNASVSPRDNQSDNTTNKLTKSVIYSTDSIESTSSSSNLMNSSSSPSDTQVMPRYLYKNLNANNTNPDPIIEQQQQFSKNISNFVGTITPQESSFYHKKSIDDSHSPIRIESSPNNSTQHLKQENKLNTIIENLKNNSSSSISDKPKRNYFQNEEDYYSAVLNEKLRKISIIEDKKDVPTPNNSRKTSQEVVRTRRDNSAKRPQARSLSNAPLARAESIEIENKKMQPSSGFQKGGESFRTNYSTTPESVLSVKKRWDNSEEETSSSANEILNNEANTSILLTSQQQQHLSSIFKKTTQQHKVKSSKIFKDPVSSNNDRMPDESDDLLNESHHKFKKLKRKKSLQKAKLSITPETMATTNAAIKKANNKSAEDLQISSSLENTKADESEDGLATITATNSNKNSKSFVGKISKTITNFNKKHQSPVQTVATNSPSSNTSTTTFAQKSSTATNPIQSPATSFTEKDLLDVSTPTARGAYGIGHLVINPPTLHSTTNLNSSLTYASNSNSQPSSSKRAHNFSNSNPISNSNNDFICLENDCLSNTSGIPYIVEKCISYIEEFGIDSEGIYRVPGHKQYTDSLFDDFINRQESINLKSYSNSQINVNIVATVIKEYFRHLQEPIFGSNLKEFIELSKHHFNQSTNLLSQITQATRSSSGNSQSALTSRQVTPPSSLQIKKNMVGSPIISSCDIQSPVLINNNNNNSLSSSSSSSNLDKSQQLSEASKIELIDSIKLRFRKLNRVNFLTLKAIFLHLSQIASNSGKNNMDSNNLSICWWPTLLRPKFEDFNETEILRKTLQPFIRFIIDNARDIFNVNDQQ